jgi:MFS family permease
VIDMGWMNKDVALISVSAFFADLGYQAIIAALPIILVYSLGGSPAEFGLASAIAFGGGAVSAYIGGIAGDRYGRKKMAVIGNLLIVIMALVGIATNSFQAIIFFALGWWARNFRTPSRRAMLSEASPKVYRSSAFGFLHLLDIGGGAIAVLILILLLSYGFKLNSIILLAAIPLLVSTLVLIPVKAGADQAPTIKQARIETKQTHPGNGTYRAVLAAATLFGFSYYNLGFPILTVFQISGSDVYGIASYLVYLSASAFAGYVTGIRIKLHSKTKTLAGFGYLAAGGGSVLMGAAFYFKQILLAYFAVGILGVSLGVIEVLEPTIISLISKKRLTGKAMGSLTASRSVGIVVSNIVMGVIYVLSPVYSYAYAFVMAAAAGVVILLFAREVK